MHDRSSGMRVVRELRKCRGMPNLPIDNLYRGFLHEMERIDLRHRSLDGVEPHGNFVRPHPDLVEWRLLYLRRHAVRSIDRRVHRRLEGARVSRRLLSVHSDGLARQAMAWTHYVLAGCFLCCDERSRGISR